MQFTNYFKIITIKKENPIDFHTISVSIILSTMVHKEKTCLGLWLSSLQTIVSFHLWLKI